MAQLNKLTDSKVQSQLAPGRYSDGGGLYLSVKKPDYKSWIFMFTLKGAPRREMGLGGYPDVSLRLARDLATAARALVRGGTDPIVARAHAQQQLAEEDAALNADQAAQLVTFRGCAGEYVASKSAEWKNAKHASQWISTLETYAYPVIGDLHPADVTLDHMKTILTPIWQKKTETATRLMNRVAKVLGYTSTLGLRPQSNPAAWRNNLEFVFPNPSKIARPAKHARLDPAGVPDLVADLIDRPIVTAAALMMIILTAQRQSEVRLARRQEFDFKAKVWSIPIERVKRPDEVDGQQLPHLVPIGALEEWLVNRYPAGPQDYVFPGLYEARNVSETAIRKLIKNYKPKYGHFTMHGFRSSFKDWVIDRPLPPEADRARLQDFLSDRDTLTEAHLGHDLGDDTKLAYLRSVLLEQRREIVQDWQRYCLSKVPAKRLKLLGLSDYVTPRRRRSKPSSPAASTSSSHSSCS